MGVNLVSSYGSSVDPATTEYPFGRPKNDTVAGDQTGTPGDQKWVSDIYGLFAAVLTMSGITPSNDADRVGASQYLQGFTELSSGRGSFCIESTGSAANAYLVEPITNAEPMKSYFDNMTLIFDVAAANTGASTINAFGLGTVAITQIGGAALTSGQLTGRVTIVYNLTAGEFELRPPALTPSQLRLLVDGYVEILPYSGTGYTAGSYTIPDGRSFSDFERIEVLGAPTSGSGIDSVNTGVLTKEAIANAPTSLSCGLAFFDSRFARIVATSGTGFNVSTDSGVVSQVIGYLKPGVA
jgi:hypothetical protein